MLPLSGSRPKKASGRDALQKAEQFVHLHPEFHQYRVSKIVDAKGVPLAMKYDQDISCGLWASEVIDISYTMKDCKIAVSCSLTPSGEKIQNQQSAVNPSSAVISSCQTLKESFATGDNSQEDETNSSYAALPLTSLSGTVSLLFCSASRRASLTASTVEAIRSACWRNGRGNRMFLVIGHLKSVNFRPWAVEMTTTCSALSIWPPEQFDQPGKGNTV